MQVAVALLDHPHLQAALPPPPSPLTSNFPAGDVGNDSTLQPLHPAAAGGGGGGGSGLRALAAALNGQDPRTQLPAACVGLLVAELEHVAQRALEAAARAEAAAEAE